jgi:DNA-binding PadR family transcriptional regulator
MENSLSKSEFYILLSLAIKKRHGYEIMKQVEADSKQRVLLGPGTLYGSIKRLLQEKLIEEAPGENARRKYYMLTKDGKSQLAAEIERYNDAVELAKLTKVFQKPGRVKLAA